MASRSNSRDLLFLGIDGGGTSCRAILADGYGNELGRGTSGPSNPFQDMGLALESIREAASAAMRSAGIAPVEQSRIVAGVGLAGVNLASIYDAVMKSDLGFAQLHLTTDLEIACIGAHSERDGAVIVSGTGSSGCSIVRGATHIVGAHGFPLGDYGGGAWMGLEAIKASLLALDGFIPPTRLNDIVEECFAASGQALVEKMSGAQPSEFARAARFVFAAADDGDEAAGNIVTEGAAYLSELARKLWATDPPAMAMLGGLSDLMLPRLDDDVASRIVPADNEAVTGALLYAKRQHYAGEDRLNAAAGK